MISIIVRTTFFADMINIINLDLNKISIDEKPCESIYISHVTSNSVKTLYFIVKKVNGYIDEHNRNRFFTLLHTDKDKDALKNTENYGRK